MSLTVGRGAIAHFDEPKVTEYEYEQTRTSHGTRIDKITGGEIYGALLSKCASGVDSGAYYYTDSDGVTQYAYCAPTYRITTETFVITLYDGTVITETRSYQTNFTAGDSVQLVYPAHAVGLLRSYFEPITNDNYGMALNSDRTKWESRWSLSRLHLFYLVENLVLERDSEGHVIWYHFETEGVEYIDTYSASHYGTYWDNNSQMTGDTVEVNVEIEEEEQE